jgi:hypothetical protein
MATKTEIRQVTSTLAAAYPSWQASEETFALFESILRPCSFEAIQQAVMEILCSPREFAPPVGLIYSRAREIDEDRRRMAAHHNRRWEPGTVAYTGTGQRFEAGEDGLMRPVPEPEPQLDAGEFLCQRKWVKALIEKANAPRAVCRRAIAPFGRQPERVDLTKLLAGKAGGE